MAKMQMTTELYANVAAILDRARTNIQNMSISNFQTANK